MSSEKFCLKWNDFEQNIVSSYTNLRREMSFSDVTLVCEEDIEIEAHKIILSASSPFFSKVLQKNKHPHPLIYMRGLRATDLVAIVDFIYQGEANIYQDDLDGFLALAEELQLKGLARSEEETLEAKEEFMPKIQKPVEMKELVPKIPDNIIKQKTFENIAQNNRNHENNAMVLVGSKQATNADIDGLKVQINSMMEHVSEGESKWKCNVCGKTAKTKQDIGRHIESHIEGISYPCNQCGTVSRSSNSHKTHISQKHRK